MSAISKVKMATMGRCVARVDSMVSSVWRQCRKRGGADGMVNVAGATAGGASVSPEPGGPIGVVDYAGFGGINGHVEISHGKDLVSRNGEHVVDVGLGGVVGEVGLAVGWGVGLAWG